MAVVEAKVTPRLKTLYVEEIRPQLIKQSVCTHGDPGVQGQPDQQLGRLAPRNRQRDPVPRPLCTTSPARARVVRLRQLQR